MKQNSFSKKFFPLLIIVLFLTIIPFVQAGEYDSHVPTDVSKDWRLGMQLWTFHKYTFKEAIDKTASLGVDWVEGYPGQAYSKDEPDVKIGPGLSKEKREEIKKMLKEKGLRLVNFGVISIPDDEAGARTVFDFAKDMGIETIVSEPKENEFDLIEKLCDEYQINVAIHNHPKPSHYWNPDKILEVTKGRSKRIGACADVGHWIRSGIDPVEALKKLDGRIISFHFGDVEKFGDKKSHDVIWGQGVGKTKELLYQLHKMGFKGVFSIEYEYNWLNSMPDVRQCIRFFNNIAAELDPSGWKNLFADDLSNAIYKKGSWKLDENDILSITGDSYIWSKEKYGDFILNVDFKLSPKANSGVFLRAGDLKNYVQSSIEVQIHESTDGSKHGQCGAIYDCLSPSKMTVKKPGEWNRYTIVCKANKIYVVLNGVQIIDMDLDKWTEPHKNPDGTKNKFNTALKDFPRVGNIGLQYHGHPLWFRNIKIKELK